MNGGIYNNCYNTGNSINNKNIPIPQNIGGINPNFFAQSQQNFSNLDNAFKPGKTLINKPNFMNPGTLIHDNVALNVFSEEITEYRINIDSLDRDICVYPNPFSFTVKFNGLSKGSVRTEFIRRGELVPVNDYFPGTPGPVINKEFRNVKYVKLDNVILPRFHRLNIFSDNCSYDKDICIQNERFIILSIDELDECDRTYSTSDSGIRINPETGEEIRPPVPFCILFPDSKKGNYYISAIPLSSQRFFKNGQLANINKMTIKFYDSCGLPLCVNGLYTFDELQKACACGHPISLTDPRHPLNKNIQVHISFIIGVVEEQIATLNKFER